MAAAHTRPDTSGARSRSPVFTTDTAPALAELLHACSAECAGTRQALAGLVQLLQGCDGAHPVSAGSLLALLEPMASSLDVLCGDLRTADKFFPHTPAQH